MLPQLELFCRIATFTIPDSKPNAGWLLEISVIEVQTVLNLTRMRVEMFGAKTDVALSPAEGPTVRDLVKTAG
jgi:hypothetical protein